MTQYALDNSWEHARQRISAVEAWLDPGTVSHLQRLDIRSGMQCLEVAAGGGSIATWLADQVGADGYVLATDINPRLLASVDRPNLETRQHDITADPPRRDTFDLAHARLLLMHLPERQRALHNIARSLKPGGWFLAEEMDLGVQTLDSGCDGATAALFQKLLDAHNAVMRAHGGDPNCGRELVRELTAAGFEHVEGEGRLSVCHGGTRSSTAWRWTFQQFADEAVQLGAISASDVPEILNMLDDPNVTFLSQAIVAVYGRRPLHAE